MTSNSEDKFHVFIDGSVGVGKTTLLLNLVDKFEGSSIFCIREYIDYKGIPENEAEERLAAVLRGEASNFDFQKFILGITELQLGCEEYKRASIILWERHPLKSLEVFAKTTVTHDQYELLFRQCKEMLDNYDVPDSITYNIIDTSKKSKQLVSDIAYQCIITKMVYNTKYIALKLRCSNILDQLGRIISRGRACERKQYADISKLKKLNNAYN